MAVVASNLVVKEGLCKIKGKIELCLHVCKILQHINLLVLFIRF